MPINQALLNDIAHELGNSVTPSLSTDSAACDLYEAYVFAIALTAARLEGFTVTYYNRSGSIPGKFVFRTGPGAIFQTTTDYCHAELTVASKPTLELHVGIYIQGMAKVRHECDVSLIYRTEAEKCRTNCCHPHYKQVAAAAECKLYQGAKSSLTIGLGRSFLGLAVDIKGVDCCFVSDRHSKSIQDLVYKHKGKITREDRATFMSVVPSNVDAVKELEDHFRGVFINFKLKE